LCGKDRFLHAWFSGWGSARSRAAAG
jgi:hypothetical protein